MWPTTDTTTAWWRSDSDRYWQSIDAAVREEGCDSPVAVLDLTAFEHNVADLRRRAGGVPIRVASKSIRVRTVISEILARDGFAGVLAYDVAEAIWLATESGITDVLLGYPSVRPHALRSLIADDVARSRVTLLVDSTDHLDVVDALVAPAGRGDVRVAIDLDASLRLGGGRCTWACAAPRAQSRAGPVSRRKHRAARRFHPRRGDVVRGAGGGNGQRRAGKPLTNAAVRLLQQRSMAELVERRVAAIRAISEVRELEFVNGGGTGSLEVTATDPSVTDIAAGSGFSVVTCSIRTPISGPLPLSVSGSTWCVCPHPASPPARAAAGSPRAHPAPTGCRFRCGRPGCGMSEPRPPVRCRHRCAMPTDWPSVIGCGSGTPNPVRSVNESASWCFVARDASGCARVVDRLPTYRGEGKCFL